MGSTEKKVEDLNVLEEDDEFEEFEQDNWDIRREDQSDIKVWEDNWDDDNIDSDFANHLRAELEKQGLIQMNTDK